MSPSLQTSKESEKLKVHESREGRERERVQPASSEREGGDWLSICEPWWKIDSVSGVHKEDRALRRGGGEL